MGTNQAIDVGTRRSVEIPPFLKFSYVAEQEASQPLTQQKRAPGGNDPYLQPWLGLFGEFLGWFALPAPNHHPK